MRRAYSLTPQRLPKQRVRLVRIRDLHAVDLHKNEVVQLFRLDAGVELRNDFTDRGCFTSARCAGDVDAGAGTSGDCGFEVFVDGGELFCPARERRRHRGDMKGCASGLEGGRRGVIRRENASTEWSEFKGLLDNNSGILSVQFRSSLGGAAYRLCVGVMNFCGVPLLFDVGVEAWWIFLLLLGVFGVSTSLVGSHYESKLGQP